MRFNYTPANTETHMSTHTHTQNASRLVLVYSLPNIFREILQTTYKKNDNNNC